MQQIDRLAAVLLGQKRVGVHALRLACGACALLQHGVDVGQRLPSDSGRVHTARQRHDSIARRTLHADLLPGIRAKQIV